MGMSPETVMPPPGAPPQPLYSAAAAAAVSPGSSAMSAMSPDAWGYGGSSGGSAAAASASSTSASSPVAPGSSNAAVETAAAEAYAQQQLELPADVFAEAQRHVYEQAERNENVQSIDELLLNDDRRDVPELYQGESDTEDMSFFSISRNGAANSSGEEEDEGMRFLAASLLH